MPGADHYSFLGTCTDAGKEVVPLCKLAPEQAAAHKAAIDEALALFGRAFDIRPR